MSPPPAADTDFQATEARLPAPGLPPVLARFDPEAEARARDLARAAAAFDVCHPALALRAVLLVQAVLAVVALGGAATAADWGARQASLAFGGAGGSLLWLVAVCAARRPLGRLGPMGRSAVVLGLGAASAVAVWLPLAWAGLVQGGTLRGAGVLLAGAGFAALLWAWLDLRARIRQPADASARLAELQSRIRPHFLFNALNTALALVQVDPERAEAVLEDLAQIFRTALAEVGASVSLAEEIDLARRYLAIEQVRFGARLQVQWQIDPAVHAARVPPLVLQPLVENAVRHGIEPASRGGRVSVSASLQRGQVVVLVSNTLGDAPGSPGHGMALHNIRERLRLLHDVAAQCDVWREEGQFHARIMLPAP
ncbi:Histidine kinase [Rubrivivax sp. A210]|uniref:sensor histidine kinase n=1 Tax=Rubrivivax sp. A210 TaxID=2772301 RepID=UPI0019B50AA9|nr:histidine kinase [Rubrivivax sp. A210]CAD5372362.1 Histidine kinase [Rubrivivax sp. A210]